VTTALEPATGELVVLDAPAPATLFGTLDPHEIMLAASKKANVLAGVIREKQLAVTIGGREHVRVEGWTLLGTLLGVFPVLDWTRKLEDGWEARVEARTLAGQVVGAAEAECLRSEKSWEKRDDYALRSMAQTRATSKALRLPLGFVMALTGYETTPAEEVPTGAGGDATPRATKAQLGKLRRLERDLKAVRGGPPNPHADWPSYIAHVAAEWFGGRKIAALTKDEASRLIKAIERYVEEGPMQQQPPAHDPHDIPF
jgi:hypothetical protein